MKSNTRGRLALAGLGLAAAATLPFLLNTPANAGKFADKTIAISFSQIRIQDEDDPLSNDEPYLINIGFRCKIQITGGTAKVAPGTLTTHNIGTAVHNDLGRSGDNWADEVENYNFIPQFHLAKVPAGEAGWAVGVVSVFFEEDGFSNSTANLLRSKIKTAVHSAISNLSVAGLNTNAITEPIVAKIERDLGRAAKNFDIGGIIRGIASAVDPDDFGGVNIIMAATLPGGALTMFAGVPPDNVASVPLNLVPANGSKNFDVGFPAGAISQVPWNARYTGQCRVRGKVAQSG